jgi:hypothetical protein
VEPKRKTINTKKTTIYIFYSEVLLHFSQKWKKWKKWIKGFKDKVFYIIGVVG